MQDPGGYLADMEREEDIKRKEERRPELEEKIEMLGRLRKQIAEIEESTGLKNLKKQMSLVESDIRILAIEEYAETGDKNVHEFVSIAEMSKLVIEDKKATFDWCREMLPIALTVDEKIVKQNIKKMDESMIPSYIKITSSPQARISTKLGQEPTPEK